MFAGKGSSIANVELCVAMNIGRRLEMQQSMMMTKGVNENSNPNSPTPHKATAKRPGAGTGNGPASLETLVRAVTHDDRVLAVNPGMASFGSLRPAHPSPAGGQQAQAP